MFYEERQEMENEMNTQPEALRLADRLGLWGDQGDLMEAAAELRRLHAANEVLKAIASIAHCGGMAGMTESDALIAIRRATLPYFVTVATEEQHRATIASVKDAA